MDHPSRPANTEDLLRRAALSQGTASGHAPLRRPGESGLDRPTARLETRGHHPGHVQGIGLYTKTAEKPARIDTLDLLMSQEVFVH